MTIPFIRPILIWLVNLTSPEPNQEYTVVRYGNKLVLRRTRDNTKFMTVTLHHPSHSITLEGVMYTWKEPKA